jgi:hypothetical protein
MGGRRGARAISPASQPAEFGVLGKATRSRSQRARFGQIQASTGSCHHARRRGRLARWCTGSTRLARKHVPDWRWMLDPEDSPRYLTMRLFRQPKRGVWDRVFDQMRVELGCLVRVDVGLSPRCAHSVLFDVSCVALRPR